jgi:dihydroorotase
MIVRIFILAISLYFFQATTAQPNVLYDVVLTGGRVIDPETKLDTIKNVGIINNRIAQISSEPLKGKEMINVTGLIVAPGFIDRMYMAEPTRNRNTSCMTV